MATRRRIVEATSTNPYENLALENLLLQQVGEDEIILYLWQNAHTVVIGRNQNAWQECDVAQLEADGGRLARRLSGGGAVYHDLGNLNYTFIARKAHYDVVAQTQIIICALAALGIGAEASGRNDLHVDGRKISGNAYYSHQGRCYHHGTLLYDVDTAQMARYLNVAPDKLRSKGVASVKSRVQNLREISPSLTIPDLKNALTQAFAAGGEVEGLALDGIDERAWQAETAKMADWQWRLGQRFAFDRSLGHRFDWGRVDLALAVEGGVVRQAAVYSDALVPDFIDALAPSMEGVRYDRGALVAAIAGLSIEEDWQPLRDDLQAWLGSVAL
ncbi:MAG: lipoate--protein ligase [Peptococcaceae bacterium]|nr:lipoate--protein ligase [Peptococcaceae bacterium]